MNNDDLGLHFQVVTEYERAVIFRLGRLRKGGSKGPGIFSVIPCIDTYRCVDLRTVSFDVPPQEVRRPENRKKVKWGECHACLDQTGYIGACVSNFQMGSVCLGHAWSLTNHVLSDSVPRFGDSERGRRGLLQRDRRRAGALQRR